MEKLYTFDWEDERNNRQVKAFYPVKIFKNPQNTVSKNKIQPTISNNSLTNRSNRDVSPNNNFTTSNKKNQSSTFPDRYDNKNVFYLQEKQQQQKVTSKSVDSNQPTYRVQDSYSYENEKIRQTQPPQAPPIKQPKPQPQQQKSYQSNNYDSFDRLPTKNSPKSDSTRMPMRIYQPQYYDNSEAYQQKMNKIDKQNRQNPSYYESNYVSPYRKTDNVDYLKGRHVSNANRPNWKL
jgi:hypothetical protein